ncbi:ornithine cyclodeaminase [Marivibrio halodurans]|uniref:Ornithine cyclodeaminase n=1 Tax=Marivibrio halodurans TaxID=2039722 RepID=A0A8J7SKF2_9PROT|nr:ornithine cyclodeaminase [Marivibrio halodurans]MBP5856173.1 ornithine cyclodeaminase [Marivibrio halodurans]
MTLPFIVAADVSDRLTWRGVVSALRAGHAGRAGHAEGRPRLDDSLLSRGGEAVLSRVAWIDGLGIGVKTATVFPGNAAADPPGPSVQALMTLFDDATGAPTAVLDGVLVTDWKTAADSALGASLLARPDSRVLTVIGAGTVARNLIAAHRAVLPGLERVMIWNRTAARAHALAEGLRAEGLGAVDVEAVSDLPAAVGRSDIVACATMATAPVLLGDWVRPGTHVDLVGAYRPDMREADDALIAKARLFADCRETTIDHIGEFMIPIAAGVIGRDALLGDLHDLCAGAVGRRDAGEVTLFKNGGGAHLDLMVARHIVSLVPGRG